MTKVSRNAGNGNTDKVWPNYPRKDPPPKRSRPSSPPNTSKTPIGTASTQDAAVSPPASKLKDTTASSSSGSDKESMSPDAEGGSSPSPTPVANVSGGRSGSRRKGGLTANLANPEVLDCLSCRKPLFPRFPLYQCTKGHILCSPCCKTHYNKCTICRCKMGIHCRGLEKVLQSLTFPCDNSYSGCSKVFSSYRDKIDHDGTCEFIPYYCPYTSCNFSGFYTCFYKHVTEAHLNCAQRFELGSVTLIVGNHSATDVLLERYRNTVFVCTRRVESYGTEVDVVCVGPSSAKGAPFSCDLTAKVLPVFSSDKDTPTLLNMKMGVECVQESTVESRKGKYLFIPTELMDNRRMLELELIIRGSQA